MSSRFIYDNDDMIEDIKTLYKSARYKATHEYKNGTYVLYEKSNELLYKLILKCNLNEIVKLKCIVEENTPDVNFLRS